MTTCHLCDSAAAYMLRWCGENGTTHIRALCVGHEEELTDGFKDNISLGDTARLVRLYGLLRDPTDAYAGEMRYFIGSILGAGYENPALRDIRKSEDEE